MSTPVSELASLIGQYLSEYTEEVTAATKKAVDVTAKAVDAEIKSKITFTQRTGNYVKAFRIKKSYEDMYNKRKTWYVSGEEYRLTHLLENGHALRGGGRVKAFPHVIYGQQLAEKRLQELIEEGIENAGR